MLLADGLAVRRHPAAFLSYARFDDQHDNGRLSEFRQRLSGEVQVQSGEMFDIFQDRNDITWGQEWHQRLQEALDAVSFLIPIVTPGFFKSSACRSEFERFVEREKQLKRRDLILPVYYINCPILHNQVDREADAIASTIASRQWADWRELRFEPFTSPRILKMIAELAKQIVESLGRRELVSAERVRPMRVVDALHRGDHVTLADALKVAQPGERILIRRGLYAESIVIDQPVEIIGDGEPGDVIIEANGRNTILFRANFARIANLTLRGPGGATLESKSRKDALILKAATSSADILTAYL